MTLVVNAPPSSPESAPPSPPPYKNATEEFLAFLTELFEDFKNEQQDFKRPVKLPVYIGVVGRPGAGKSTLINALLRLTRRRSLLTLDAGESSGHMTRAVNQVTIGDIARFTDTVGLTPDLGENLRTLENLIFGRFPDELRSAFNNRVIHARPMNALIFVVSAKSSPSGSPPEWTEMASLIREYRKREADIEIPFVVLLTHCGPGASTREELKRMLDVPPASIVEIENSWEENSEVPEALKQGLEELMVRLVKAMIANSGVISPFERWTRVRYLDLKDNKNLIVVALLVFLASIFLAYQSQPLSVSRLGGSPRL